MKEKIERNAIIIGVVVCLIMAIAGWLTYYFSKAEAMLLDGNFSFLGALATLLALKISSIKTKTSRTYPFGQFVYESLYSLFIGLVTAGVILASIAANVLKIVGYFQGEKYSTIDTSFIIIYTIVMVILCFGLAIFFWISNRRLSGNSPILGTYTMQSTIDGLLSVGAGGALIVFGFVSPNGTFGFLTQIGDAIVVLLLCLLVCFQPIKLIKDSFIEISGGALNDPTITGKISSVVSTYIQDKEIVELFISKTGSAYLVVAFIKARFFDTCDSEELLSIKQEVTQALVKDYGYATFELALAGNTTKPVES